MPDEYIGRVGILEIILKFYPPNNLIPERVGIYQAEKIAYEKTLRLSEAW